VGAGAQTLLLSFAAIVITWLIALPMGIVGAVNPKHRGG
jgi:ABC-type dipeptide/oligopeptide/nickel transport system permease component